MNHRGHRRATVHGSFARMWGRLAGEQNNSYGEAMAFLRVLRHAHIKDTVDVFIDNLGVIQRWNGLQGHDVRGRIRGGGRAIWNRICCLSRARREAGAGTRVYWVHSHVEEEGRQNRQPNGKPQEGPDRVLRCACAWWGDASEGRYTEGEQRCDPQHYHHVGNDVADAAADRGKGLVKGHMVREEGEGGGTASPDRMCVDLSPLCGEGSHVVVGRVVQADMVSALQDAAWEGRRQRMRYGQSERARSWYWARDMSWGGGPW